MPCAGGLAGLEAGARRPRGGGGRSSPAPGALPRTGAERAEHHARAPPAHSREGRDLPILGAVLALRRVIGVGGSSSAHRPADTPPGVHRFLRHRGQRPWSGCPSAVTTSTSRWHRAHRVQRVAGCCAAPRSESREFWPPLCWCSPARGGTP